MRRAVTDRLLPEPGRLRRLLAPASVAVVGGTLAEEVIRQCDRIGYEGDIWPVNPRLDTMAGRRCVPEVAALPGVPDATFVAVDGQRTVDVVADLAGIGAGGVVCFAAGFAEVGEDGERLQAELLAAAGTMPLIGPNCYGFVNAVDRVALWPDQHGCLPTDGGAAIVTQSGNMGLNLTMQQRGLRLTHMITLGNQASVTIEECVRELLDDTRVQAIGLHLESSTDPHRFGEVALEAHKRRVPIVALKTGVTERGASIALSHTAALAGTAEAYEALFDRYGIYRVRTLPELLETLKLLTVMGPLDGRRVASMSCSGGEASLIADRAADFNLEFRPFEAEQAARIEDTLTNGETVSNPLDYHTFIWGNRKALTACFSAVMEGPLDATMLVLDFPSGDADDAAWWPTLESLVDAKVASGANAVVMATLPENMSYAARTRLAEHGIPGMEGIGETLTALEAASWFGERFRQAPAALHLAASSPILESRSIDEAEGKALIASQGVIVPEGAVATARDVPRIADSLGYPVALKALDMDHKSDHGAVAVDLRDAGAVAEALTRISHGNGEGEYLVERHVTDAVAELLVGVRREHPVGTVVTIAAGGTLVELLADAAHLLAPPTRDEVRSAIAGLRVSRLMAGYRGRPAGDIDAVVDATLALVDLAASRPDLTEVEVNPLLVLPEGKGAIAADVLVRLAAQL